MNHRRVLECSGRTWGAVLLLGSAPAFADVACGVGMMIEAEDLSRGGRIAEIGTESPHKGWYRIVWDWNPKGDWYDPGTWEMRAVGSTERCTVASPDVAPAPAARPASASGHGSSLAAPRATPAPVGPRPPAAQTPAPTTVPAASARAAEALPRGRYACSAPGAGTFPITIEDDATYVDRAGDSGRYRYDSADGLITFGSGSLKGQYSKLLKPGKFGLSSEPTRQFYVVCNLKR